MVALLSRQAPSPRLDALRKCLVMCAGAKPVPLIKARLVDVMLFCSITSTSIFLCSLKLETFTHVRDWFCGGRGARVREAGFDGGASPIPKIVLFSEAGNARNFSKMTFSVWEAFCGGWVAKKLRGRRKGGGLRYNRAFFVLGSRKRSHLFNGFVGMGTWCGGLGSKGSGGTRSDVGHH